MLSAAKNTNVLYNNSATATAASTCLHTGSHCHPHFFMSLCQCFPVCLESCEKYFIEHMDAKMVLEAPQSKKVIPEHIERKIMEADKGHKKQMTSILMLINPVAGVEVLESCEEDFIKRIERKIKQLMQRSHLLCAGYNGSAVCS